MSLLKHPLCALVLAWAPLATMAQSEPSFESLSSISASDLVAKVTGKKFSSKSANGSLWIFEYKSNGYVFISLHGRNGQRTFSKPWRAEDGKLCSSENGIEECRAARLDGSTLVVQITPTESVRYIEQ